MSAVGGRAPAAGRGGTEIGREPGMPVGTGRPVGMPPRALVTMGLARGGMLTGREVPTGSEGTPGRRDVLTGSEGTPGRDVPMGSEGTPGRDVPTGSEGTPGRDVPTGREGMPADGTATGREEVVRGIGRETEGRGGPTGLPKTVTVVRRVRVVIIR